MNAETCRKLVDAYGTITAMRAEANLSPNQNTYRVRKLTEVHDNLREVIVELVKDGSTFGVPIYGEEAE